MIETEIKTNNYVILAQGINYNLSTGEEEIITIDIEFMTDYITEKTESLEMVQA